LIGHPPIDAPSLQLGATRIGADLPPVFWPDIDVYFQGDVDVAYGLVDAVAEAGGRFIKGAILHRADLCLDCDVQTEYYVTGVGKRSESYRKIIERHVVPLSRLDRVFRRARDRGLESVLSVYDVEGIAFASDIGAVAVKIPSSNIVHAPLIRRAARCGLPLVLDTGRSTIEEIDRAVRWARDAGADRLIVQHSPPGPPAKPSDFHLRMMPELGRRANALYGLSDHSPGEDTLLIAVALGAAVIEKGVCADGTPPDIDIAHALPVSRVGPTLLRIQETYETLGALRRSLPADRPLPRDRMGLVAGRDLAAGERLDERNTRFAFPNLGIPVEHWDTFAGRSVSRPIVAGSPIRTDDLR
jgi:N,N'-diacetyllegionaminate synthase